MIDQDLVDALAVARITRLVVEDRVPFGWLRDRILRWADHDTGGLGSDSRLAELVTCPWCMSIWVAGAVMLARRYLPGWRVLSRLLACSLVAGVIAERTSSGG